MLKTRNSKKNIFYLLAALIGLGLTFWLMLSLIDVGSVPENQFDNKSHLQNVSTSNVEEVENKLEPVKDVPKEVASADNGTCSEQCLEALAKLEEGVELDDDEYRKLQVYVKDIVSYLQNNDGERQYYVLMALTTSDGNKVGFLKKIFQRLPEEQKLEIADNFLSSENKKMRVNGVELIVGHKVSDLGTANKLMDIFLTEDNPHVKSTILRHVRSANSLRGEVALLDKLDSGINNEADVAVKIDLFKAKMQLSKQPTDIIPSALDALRSREPEFQMAGVIAIDQVLGGDSNYLESGVNINTIKSELQTIRSLTPPDGDNKKRIDRLQREADSVYSRHFDN